MINDLSSIDTLILAGGFGTRLRPIFEDTPKCLVPINGKPFIDILLDYYIKQGLRKFVICVGHLKEQVIEYLEDRSDCDISFSIENEALGTGGAIKNAKLFINSDNFFVINGDSYIEHDVNQMINIHNNYLATILVYEDSNSKDYGNISVNDNGELEEFNEKSNISSSNLVNGGRYLFSKSIFDLFPKEKSFSLEYDVFPNLLLKHKVITLRPDTVSYDIGTPDRYDLFLRKSSSYL